MKVVRITEAQFHEQAERNFQAALSAHAQLAEHVDARNAQIEAEHASAVEDAERAHEAEVERVKADHEERRDATQAENQQRAAAYKAEVKEHERRVSDLTAQHEAEVAAVTERHTQTVAHSEAIMEAERERFERMTVEHAEAEERRKTLRGKLTTRRRTPPVEALVIELPELTLPELALPEPPVEPEKLPLPESDPEPEKVLPPEQGLTDAPAPPERHHGEAPVTYTVTIIRGKDLGDEPWLMVDTPYGPARAHVGSAILENDVTGDKHIVPEEELALHYTRPQ